MKLSRLTGRKILYWMLGSVGTLLLLAVIGLTGLLGTQSGRLWLLDTGLGLLEGPVRVTVEGARSPGLGEWSFDRIIVTRQQELWLDIRQLHLRWQPSELLHRRLLVNTLGAAQLDVYTGAGGPAPEKPQQEESGGGAALPAIAVESFQLGRLNIIDTARDIPAYTLSGGLRLFWEGLPFKLDLEARSLPQAGKYEPGDYAPMRLTIHSKAQSAQRIKIQGALLEKPGGQLGQLLQLPPGSGLDVEFAAVVTTTDDGYTISLEQFQMPFLERRISANGKVHIGNELQQAQIETLVLRTGKQEHYLSGYIARDDMNLTLQVNAFPLALLSPWLEQLGGGALSAQLQIAGAPTSPNISGQLSANSHYRDYPIDVQLAGAFNQQRLNFERLSLQFGKAQFQAHGRLDLQGDNSDLEFTLRDFPIDYLKLAGLERPEALEARIVQASGSLTGNYRDPQGQLEATAQGHYRQTPFTARLKAQGTRQRILLAEARVSIGSASARAEGVIDLAGTDSDLRLVLDSLPISLAELAPGVTLPPELDAEINGSAHLTGGLDAPQASGELHAAGSYRGQPFDVVLNARGNRQKIHLEQARAQVGEALVQAQGTIDLEGTQTDVEVVLRDAPLSLLELAQIEPPDGLSAEISGAASLRGALTSPTVKSELRMVGIYQELPFELVADGSLVNRRLQLNQVELTLDGTTALQIHGYLQPDAYDLQLAINDLPTRTLSALGLDLVTGHFNGNLRIKGTPAQPHIQGNFSYSGRLTGPDMTTGEQTTYELGWHTQLATRQQVLHVTSNFTRNQRKTGTFNLSLPLTPYLTHIKQNGSTANFPLAFKADGALDLAILSLVLNPNIHRISGRAAVRVTASGDLGQPRINGVFELLNTHYENSLSGTVLTNIQLLLKSSGARLTIAQARAEDANNGHLQISGAINWLEHDNNDAVDIRAAITSFSLLDRENLEGGVSGELFLTGSFNELWLHGELSVTHFAANIDAAIQSRIPEIEVTEVYGDPDEIETKEEAEPGDSPLPVVHLDLTIEARQQAYLRGRGLDAELAGEIHLGGTLENPTYEGEFSIVRGVFEVFGRKFELLQGKVLFANNALYMTIPGEYEHEDYTIRVELSGTVEDLSLSLSSVPALPEDEILSLLIFGESAQDITPFQALRLASAVQTLRGGGGFDPIGSVRDALDVDTLSVESTTTDTGTGVSVGVGKYISDQVYLEVKRTPSEIQPWQGSVEIQLTPRLHLRSTTGGEGRAEAELLWERDF